MRILALRCLPLKNLVGMESLLLTPISLSPIKDTILQAALDPGEAAMTTTATDTFTNEVCSPEATHFCVHSDGFINYVHFWSTISFFFHTCIFRKSDSRCLLSAGFFELVEILLLEPGFPETITFEQLGLLSLF